MKTGLMLYFFFSAVVLVCKGLRVLGPSGPLSVQPGDSVVLPCYVETPIPTEELEVEWRRTDSETVVYLFQDGESRPEAQAQVYHDRTHFFTEEVAHGNFSLLLKDVTTEDTGVYMCVVHRNQESNQTLIEIKMSEYLVVSGGHVVSAYAGEEATLNCSVHSHIPSEEIEQISWKQMDQDVVVLLYSQGEIQPESTHERYRDRVELFSSEEMHKGNFSLRLKNVQTEDKGLYMCEALHEDFSANTTVEVLQLGLSAIHKLELFLCACVCLCGASLLFFCIKWRCFKGDGNRIIKLQHVLVFCPNIVMFLAFILWGQLGGFFNEVAVCSSVNLLRIIQILNFTPFINTFKGRIQKRIKDFTSIQCPVFYMVVYSVLGYSWPAEYRNMMIIAGVVTTIIFIGFFLAILLRHKLSLPVHICLRQLFDIGFGLMFSMSLFSIFLIINWRGNAKDVMGLIFVSVLLFIMTVLAYAELWVTARIKPMRKQPLVPFSRLSMCGAAVLFVVNSVTLSVELILSARNGKRTIEDLQLILLPFEWVFAIGYIIAIFVVEYSKQKVFSVCATHYQQAVETVEQTHTVETVPLQQTHTVSSTG